MSSPRNCQTRPAFLSPSNARFKRGVSALLTAAIISASGTALAEEKVRTAPTVTTTLTVAPPPGATAVPPAMMYPLKKGDVAPFAGVLLNPSAVAKITVDVETQKKECEIEVKKEVGETKAFYDTKLADKNGELKYTTTVLEARIKLQEGEIERLRKEGSKATSSSMWWTIGGVGAGVGITLTITFLVGLASK